MNQKDPILSDLKSGIKITPIDALKNYGCFRLGARIEELRKEGHNIQTKIIKENGKHYAQYKLIPAKNPKDRKVSSVPTLSGTQGYLFKEESDY